MRIFGEPLRPRQVSRSSNGHVVSRVLRFRRWTTPLTRPLPSKRGPIRSSSPARLFAHTCEHSFFRQGYDTGFAHGEQHGRIEGGELGRKTGFEIWEELGFYEGQARFWSSALAAAGDAKSRRCTPRTLGCTSCS